MLKKKLNFVANNNFESHLLNQIVVEQMLYFAIKFPGCNSWVILPVVFAINLELPEPRSSHGSEKALYRQEISEILPRFLQELLWIFCDHWKPPWSWKNLKPGWHFYLLSLFHKHTHTSISYELNMIILLMDFVAMRINSNFDFG